MKKITIFIITLSSILFLVSCDNVFKEKYKVQFKDGGNTILELETVQGSKLTKPEDLVKLGYINEGWHTNLEDDLSKWNFENDIVTSHLILHLKWTIDTNYTVIDNVRLIDGVLMFDGSPTSTYEIQINDKVFFSTIPSIDLNDYLLQLNNINDITITPIEEGKTSVPASVKVQYSASSIIELLTMDFEDFSKGRYEESIIEYNSYRFKSSNSLITKQINDNKNGERAIRFNNEGLFEFLLPIEEFFSMSFYLGDYLSESNKNAKLTLSYRYNLNSDWKEFKEYTSTPNLTKYEITKDDLVDFNDNETLYLKFQKDNKDNSKINVDDIHILTQSNLEFRLLENDLINLSPYYKSIEGLSGKELIDELNFILSTNLKDVKYSDVKQILEIADAKQDDPTKVVGIYNQVLYRANWGSKSEWHREHVWPNSRLAIDRVKESGVNQGSDPHNLRAINPSVNSSRSNRYYSKALDSNELGHTTTTGAYYPGHIDKGDVARILLYMVVRYEDEGLILTSNEKLLKDAKAYTKDGALMGKLDLLYDWHLEDPVDEFEVNRNNVIFNYQGNRNPFIDHPELFEEVFNYYIKMDEGRLINVSIIVDYSLDYGYFRKNSATVFS